MRARDRRIENWANSRKAVKRSVMNIAVEKTGMTA
jgi:hypothetical protein